MVNVKTIKADLIAKGRKFCIVVSRFNEFISGKLLEGAIDTLIQHGVKDSDISVVWVPGSFEIPMTAQRIAGSGKYDAVICLGVIIRGETPHFDFIASEAAKGIAQISMTSDCPVTFGVLTTDSIEQAIERAGTKSGNKGADAAMAMLEMADLFSQI